MKALQCSTSPNYIFKTLGLLTDPLLVTARSKIASATSKAYESSHTLIAIVANERNV